MSAHAELPGTGGEERRQRSAVYGGWRGVRTLEDVEKQEALVDRWAGSNPGMVDQSDAAIARALLGIARQMASPLTDD